MSDSHVVAQVLLAILTMLLRIWGAFGLPIATSIVRGWVRIYTHPTLTDVRNDRRSEIASDVAEHIAALRAEGYHPSEIGAHVMARTLFGIWSDLTWMATRLQLLESARHSRLAVEIDLFAFRLLQPWAERELAEAQHLRNVGQPAPSFRGPLNRVLFHAYVRVLIFGVEEATYVKTELNRKAGLLEEHLKSARLCPACKREIETKVAELRRTARTMFDRKAA